MYEALVGGDRCCTGGASGACCTGGATGALVVPLARWCASDAGGATGALAELVGAHWCAGGASGAPGEPAAAYWRPLVGRLTEVGN